jgi:hypothetical protein
MKNVLVLLIISSILLIYNINFSEEPYIGTHYKKVTKEMETKYQELIKREMKGKFTVSYDSKNTYIYQSLSNAYIQEIMKKNPLSEKEMKQFFNEKLAPYLNLNQIREEGTSMTLAFESFYHQKDLDEEAFYKKKIEPTALIRIFPSFQRWKRMLISYQSPNAKRQYTFIKELKSPEQYYKEWGQYYNFGAFLDKLNKRMLEQNNINLDNLRKNLLNKNIPLEEHRLIDDISGSITYIAMIRRIRADLQGNEPERLENFKKWLDKEEQNNISLLRKFDIIVENLNLKPIYP